VCKTALKRRENGVKTASRTFNVCDFRFRFGSHLAENPRPDVLEPNGEFEDGVKLELDVDRESGPAVEVAQTVRV